MGKNVAVFVDVANIFYAAKAAGVDIDYVTLLKAGSAGRDLVRAYAYTGLDPDNENQRNFHDFLRRSGYKVVSKDIRKYGDGKVKANLDIELVVDMMKTARNLDVAIVVSGDGDFAPAIRAVQEMGVRVEVVSFRGNTSSDLMDVADLFTDIVQIAKVEKGSSRSGRRVAADDDLSMTEVPDKQSEGTGERGRGRGRTRRTTTTVSTAPASRGRGRVAVAPSDGADAPIVVLPGEKLSRVAAVAGPASSNGELEEVDDDAEDAVVGVDGEPMTDEAGSDEARRRRRRRGGRGRGRGRGREEGGFAEVAEGATPVAAFDADDEAEADVEAAPQPRRQGSVFGSVWDSQIGIGAPARPAPILDDDDLEEPAVPEYLLTERRQRDAGRGGPRGGGGGRGRGGAYAAALDRERFGGGRGSTPSRFAQPAPGGREGGYGRPGGDRPGGDRPGGNRQDRGRFEQRERQPFQGAPRPAPRGSGDEPWSEVPPEIEAMLRAQLGSRGASAPRREEPVRPAPEAAETAGVAGSDEPVTTGRTGGRSRSTTAGTTGRGRTRKAAAPTAEDVAPTGDAAADEMAAEAAPARRTTVRRSRAGAAADAAATETTAPTGEISEAPATKPRRATATRATASRTSTRTKAATSAVEAAEASASDGEAVVDAAPKRRTTRKKAEPAD